MQVGRTIMNAVQDVKKHIWMTARVTGYALLRPATGTSTTVGTLCREEEKGLVMGWRSTSATMAPSALLVVRGPRSVTDIAPRALLRVRFLAAVPQLCWTTGSNGENMMPMPTSTGLIGQALIPQTP